MEGNELDDISKMLSGLTKGIESQLKVAGKTLDSLNKFQEVEKKRAKVGKVIASVSYLKGGRVLIDFENENEALKYFESLKK